LEPSPDLPAPHLLREAPIQEAIFNSLFAEDAVRYGPPLRYQLKILKSLVAQIEASIEDWDAHVSIFFEDDLHASLSGVDSA
jgi:hypothetical protein